MPNSPAVPKFVYNVETKDGKLKTGKLYADTEGDARVMLAQRGLKIKSVYQVEDPTPPSDTKK